MTIERIGFPNSTQSSGFGIENQWVNHVNARFENDAEAFIYHKTNPLPVDHDGNFYLLRWDMDPNPPEGYVRSKVEVEFRHRWDNVVDDTANAGSSASYTVRLLDNSTVGLATPSSILRVFRTEGTGTIQGPLLTERIDITADVADFEDHELPMIQLNFHHVCDLIAAGEDAGAWVAWGKMIITFEEDSNAASAMGEGGAPEKEKK